MNKPTHDMVTLRKVVQRLSNLLHLLWHLGTRSRSDGTFSRKLDKLYRTLFDIKSDLGNIRKSMKSSQYEVAKNIDVTIQKHKTFGSRNNEKPAKHANLQNVAIQKTKIRKAFPQQIYAKTGTITKLGTPGK